MGRGISKTISMSNTKKMMASRKNRIENGIRDMWFGSNPHSNGEVFSRSMSARAEIMIKTVITSIGRAMAIINPIEVKNM